MGLRGSEFWVPTPGTPPPPVTWAGGVKAAAGGGGEGGNPGGRGEGGPGGRGQSGPQATTELRTGTETRVTSETEQRGRAEASRTGYRENTVGEIARVVYKVLLKSTICIHEIFLTKHRYFILFSSKILEIFVLKTFSLNCKIFNFKPRNILFSKQGCGKSGFNSS